MSDTGLRDTRLRGDGSFAEAIEILIARLVAIIPASADAESCVQHDAEGQWVTRGIRVWQSK